MQVESSLLIQGLVLISGIFAGFFAMYKLFIGALEKKDKYIESVTERFIASNDRSHAVLDKNEKALSELTSKINVMNSNDSQVLDALKVNSETLKSSMGILEKMANIIKVHENDTVKQLKEMNQ